MAAEGEAIPRVHGDLEFIRPRILTASSSFSSPRLRWFVALSSRAFVLAFRGHVVPDLGDFWVRGSAGCVCFCRGILNARDVCVFCARVNFW